MTGMTLEQFLGHTTREKSDAKTARLKGWRDPKNAKKNELGMRECSVTVWLHTQATFQARWAHQWPKIIDMQKSQTRVVWMQDFACLEDESVLRAQFKRRDGVRTNPPKVCPHCLMLEAVRAGVARGDFKWTDKLFRFETDGPKDNLKELTAGGMCGYFGKKDMSDAEKAEIRAAGIYLTDIWKEKVVAKCEYVCRVVDNDAPEKGCQIAIEIDSIGDAMKRKLFNEIRALGDDGNPLLNPYALMWVVYPDEDDPRKKYDVIALPRLKLSPEIKELITEVPPPEVDYLFKPCNMKVLRASMEEHCLTDKLDWDAIFGPVEKFCDANGVYHSKSEVSDTDPPPAGDVDSDDIPF